LFVYTVSCPAAGNTATECYSNGQCERFISPSAHGGWLPNATYTITAAACYHIAGVTVDDLPVGAISSYTFNNLAGNHTINATFAINQYSITANPVSMVR
jgi:hypothetical protein